MIVSFQSSFPKSLVWHLIDVLKAPVLGIRVIPYDSGPRLSYRSPGKVIETSLSFPVSDAPGAFVLDVNTRKHVLQSLSPSLSLCVCAR
eukprot:COSAG03_NODE_18222_length_359_cov_1.192308_1_plen_88_part_10